MPASSDEHIRIRNISSQVTYNNDPINLKLTFWGLASHMYKYAWVLHIIIVDKRLCHESMTVRCPCPWAREYTNLSSWRPRDPAARKSNSFKRLLPNHLYRTERLRFRLHPHHELGGFPRPSRVMGSIASDWGSTFSLCAIHSITRTCYV
jgi:hypothetical protein